MKKCYHQLRCQEITFFQTSKTCFVSNINYATSSELEVLERAANFLSCYLPITLSVLRARGCARAITAFWHTCTLFINTKIRSYPVALSDPDAVCLEVQSPAYIAPQLLKS